MLVLSRKKNEEILLLVDGKEIRLTVIEIRGDKVRLGFDADQSVIIKRAELTGPWLRGKDAKESKARSGLLPEHSECES